MKHLKIINFTGFGFRHHVILYTGLSYVGGLFLEREKTVKDKIKITESTRKILKVNLNK